MDPTLPSSDAPPKTRSDPTVIGGIWMIVLAAMLFLCGLCSAFFYIVAPFSSVSLASGLQNNVVLGSAAAFGLLLGAVLSWQGINAARRKPSTPSARVFPSWIVFVLAFVGAILIGAAALVFPAVATYAFPPWHFLAASLPPLALIAYAARRLGLVSGFRALLVSFSWGALAATTVAVILELMVALLVIVAAAVVLASLPDSRAIIDELQRQVLRAQRTGDLSALGNMASNPWVTAGLLFYLAIIVPPIEEALKALVVAFIDPLRTVAADALLWGMSAGAGFAVLESIFNSSIDLSAWAVLIVLRVGATIVHVANGANMGQGWYAARVEGRWDRLLFFYVVSVFFHTAWNAAAILLSSTATRASPGRDLGPYWTLVAGGLLIVLAVLAGSGFVWIVYSVRQARRGLQPTLH